MTMMQKIALFFCKLGRFIILCLGVRDFIERKIKMFWLQTNLSLFAYLMSHTRRSRSNRSPKGGREGEGAPMLMNDQVIAMKQPE